MGIRINKPHIRHGDWNAICDVCGFKFKASQLRQRWDGLVVCEADWEPQHDQDFLRIPRTERNRLPIISPRPEYKFIETDWPDYLPPAPPAPPSTVRVLGIGGAALGVGDRALGARA